jgi:soluble lytic murein transglycosylase-like protein
MCNRCWIPTELALTVMLMLPPALACAAPPHGTAARPGEQCQSAIQAAERHARLPPLLLQSIALVESGRPDSGTGRVLPWPWTINVAGTGYFYASSEEAVLAVQAFRANGIKSIDVGCTQVNLFYHPNAFASLESAFDPRTNADYAARFLRSLYASVGNWPLAAAAYHSQTAERGHAYARRVMAIWPHAARYGALPAPTSAAATGADYSMYTPEFAARLRRMDENRTLNNGVVSILDFVWANGTGRSCSANRRAATSVCPPGG